MDRIDVVIDVSNVCRADDLPLDGECRLGRYNLMIEACRETFGDHIQVLGVADANLRHLLPAGERREFNQRVDRGEINVVPKADVPLLRLAKEHGARVVAHDNFKDHRKEFPWIASADGVFWGWRTGENGLELEPRDMPTFIAFDLSRSADLDDLVKGQKLDRARLDDLLSHRWTCSNPACFSHRFADIGTPTPRWDGSDFRCSACSAAMKRGEQRPRAVQLKFRGTDGREDRRVVEQGAKVVLGRDAAEVDLTKVVEPQDLRKVSSRHLEIVVEADHWEVTDLDSRNGTWIARWDQSRQERSPWQQVEPRERVRLEERDAVSLADVLRIDRSGVLNAGL